MGKRFDISLAVLAAAIGWTAAETPALAQDGDNFARDRNVSVRGRARPEYDAVGVRLGGFMAFPELTVAGEYNDNVFATETNTQEDTIWHVTPQLDVNSLWSTHALNFHLEAPSRFYSQLDDNNTTDVIGTVDGRLDVYRDFYLHGGLQYGDMTEPLSSTPTNLPLAEPVEYTNAGANLGFVRAFNRLRLSGQARYSKFDFEDGLLFNLTPVEQDDRDRSVLEYGLRADYAISPMTALFVALGANERNYRLDPPDTIVNRDSSGYEALVGADFDISRLVRGQVGIGYLSQDYDDPSVGETSGLAVRSRVEWFPDELVTVTFSAAREVADAGAFGASSYVANNASFAIDYEWRRNIIFGVSFDYSLDDYSGIDREDRRWDGVLKADYLVNRGVAVFFEAGHYEQSSDGAQFGREYDINRAVIGVKLRR
ncbi:MAG: outer membrane beta-barrel protein [Hyphomonadaceae bacterium]|nr:outer membrane beta-barrel protein [Hyphomonadaceae bacterium]